MKIIAESAFNHNGSLKYLKDLATEAKHAGADIFTAQVMNVDAFCVQDYEKYELYKETEFTNVEWIEVFDHCKELEIDVIPCVLDEGSLDLCLSYGFETIKIHATDITNQPLLKRIAETDVKVLLETQCATNFEIRFALSILGDQVDALFNGFSNYPTEVEELNLNVLDSFVEDYGLETGFADHSLDTTEIPLMVLAKGCKYLEKHITLSRNDRHFDWQVSLYPHEFATMVQKIKHYSLALGKGVKHPNSTEKSFRNIMYKKVLKDEATLKRANEGAYFIEDKIAGFDKENVVISVIARLKSQRLKQKVLSPFHEDILIIDLIKRMQQSERSNKVVLTTSTLKEDAPLAQAVAKKGLPVFRGHPVSVVDRMLQLAFEEECGAIFRVTGDNPFTDPKLMDEMIQLYLEHDLDYVKVNNVPFGVSAELLSTKYLWKLYLDMKNPMVSEYLTWFVLNDDKARCGAIDVVSKENVELVNLSVDYQEDLDRCKQLLLKIGKDKMSDITLSDIMKNLKNVETVDGSKFIKLPEGASIEMFDYLDQWKSRNYVVRKTIEIE